MTAGHGRLEPRFGRLAASNFLLEPFLVSFVSSFSERVASLVSDGESAHRAGLKDVDAPAADS